jgi:hypothetical protein
MGRVGLAAVFVLRNVFGLWVMVEALAQCVPSAGHTERRTRR